ncbi:MAG: cupin domain-containing protein [Anaerolineales bacterium]|jgi:quercetin dioxygenase-like cupin family protein
MFTKHSDSGYRTLLDGIEIKTVAFGEKTHMVAMQLHQGYELARHSHPHEQTGYLISGHMLLEIEDDVYDVHPGDSWSIPGGVEHRAEFLEDCAAIEVFSPVRDEYLLLD